MPRDKQCKKHLLQAPDVERVNNAIHLIDRYPVVSVVCLVNTYLLDSIINPLNNWGQNKSGNITQAPISFHVEWTFYIFYMQLFIKWS